MDIMDKAVVILISLAVLAVLWGIFTYFLKESAEKRKEGNAFIVYGLLSLLVITSLWGFVRILGSFVGITNSATGSSVIETDRNIDYQINEGDNYDNVDGDNYETVNIDSDVEKAKDKDYNIIIRDDYQEVDNSNGI